MSTLEQQVDQAAEIATDKAWEETHGGEGKPDHEELWQDFLAEYLPSGTAEENDKLYYWIGQVQYWLESAKSGAIHSEHAMMYAESITDCAQKVGRILALRAIENGLTSDVMGDYRDA